MGLGNILLGAASGLAVGASTWHLLNKIPAVKEGNLTTQAAKWIAVGNITIISFMTGTLLEEEFDRVQRQIVNLQLDVRDIEIEKQRDKQKAN